MVDMLGMEGVLIQGVTTRDNYTIESAAVSRRLLLFAALNTALFLHPWI